MKKNSKQRIYLGLYFLVILGTFLYSFTQIDLSLTFSRITFLRNIITSFQYIGYFNRPLSTYLFIFILLLLYGFYIYFLKLSLSKKIDRKTFIKIIFLTGGILAFSYNAFSYDLFNYIFDAKIFTHYHQNPYLHKALDFPADPMLSFMRWTHRVYPYGPVFLFLTIPLSFAGLNIFLPTFFIFKIFIAAAYIGSVFMIGRILRKFKPDEEILGMVFFGLNPLIIIESLVSSHIDIIMVFLALFAVEKLINKKFVWALILLLLSIGIKFSTVFLIPIFLIVIYQQFRKIPLKWNKLFVISFLLLCLSVIASSKYSGNFQPWYLVLPFSIAALVSRKKYIFIMCFIMSFFSLITYVPYLYLGNYDIPVPQVMSSIITLGLIFSGAITGAYYLFIRLKRNK